MPRLTSENYLQRREWFAELWAATPGCLALIEFAVQRDLHDFFRPEQAWSDEVALEYRKAVTRQQAALPQCAGRALRHLFDAMEAEEARKAALVAAPAQPGCGSRGVVIRSQVNSEVDTKLLARALLEAARERGSADHQ